MHRDRKPAMFSWGSGLGIGTVYYFFEVSEKLAVARWATARLLIRVDELGYKFGEFFLRPVGVVTVEELTDPVNVLGLDVGVPLSKGTGRRLELRLGGHIAPAQLGVGERLGDEGPARLGVLHVVLAGLANGEPICLLLCADE